MQVDTLRKEAFERELARYKQPLSKLWESLRVSSEKQIAFLNGLCEIPSLEQISQVCNKEIARLSAQETFLVDLFKMLDTRTNLIAEMKDFESKASDPKRLFAPSFRLLYEEKFRKTAYPNLLKLEKRIMASLDSYKQGKCCVQCCRLEISQTYIFRICGGLFRFKRGIFASILGTRNLH